MSLLFEGIYGFTGDHDYLSNFYEVPTEFEGITYPTSEHAYQAAKSLDMSVRAKIYQLPSPGSAKRYGKHIEIRGDWEDVKVEMMERILRSKFSNPKIKKMLISTGDLYIEETNIWNDTFWGVCKGKGENILGKLLMKIRKEFINIK